MPKVKLEIAVTDDVVDRAVETLIKAAHTGKIGDGKIFVTNLELAVCVRTRETGEDAVLGRC